MERLDGKRQALPTDDHQVLAGEIQSLVAEKGFGFIKPSAGGADVFFHYSILDAPFETLAEGQQVKYALDSKAEKPRARCVHTGEHAAKDGSAGTHAPPSPAHARPSPNARSGQERRAADHAAFAHGFVTKLQRKKFRGFISSNEHGPEFVFAANSVTGEKRFSRLEIGDYVQFLVGERDASDPEQPVAKAVKVVEREVKIPNVKQLERHPNARKKKPTWR